MAHNLSNSAKGIYVHCFFILQSKILFFFPTCFYQTMAKNIFCWLSSLFLKKAGLNLQNDLIIETAPKPPGRNCGPSTSLGWTIFSQFIWFFVFNFLPEKWHWLFTALMWIPRAAVVSCYLVCRFYKAVWALPVLSLTWAAYKYCLLPFVQHAHQRLCEADSFCRAQ